METRPEESTAGIAAGNTDCFSVEARPEMKPAILSRKEARAAPRPEAWPETLTVIGPKQGQKHRLFLCRKTVLSHLSLGIACWAPTCEMAAVENCRNLGIIFKYLKLDVFCPEFHMAFAIYFSCLGFKSSPHCMVLECEYYITERYSFFFFFWLL